MKFDIKKKSDKEPIEIEKGDYLAIVIAAFTTIMPILFLMLGSIVLILWLLFLR